MRSIQGFAAACVFLFTVWTVFGQERLKNYSPQLVSYDSKRLASYSTRELIDLLSKESIEKKLNGSSDKDTSGNVFSSLLPPDHRQVESPSATDPTLYVKLKIDSHATDYTLSIEEEIAKRRPYKALSYIVGRTTDEVQQAWIADALANMRGREADAVLRPYVSGSRDGTAYFALKYFARACDSKALGILNRNYFRYQTSSREWATIVRSFGECKYKPAVPNLVRTVSAMMIDLGYASHLSLLAVFPNAKIEFRDPLVTQGAWEKYLRAHR